MSTDKRALILRWIEEQEALCEKAPAGPYAASLDVFDEDLEIEACVSDERTSILFRDGTGYTNRGEDAAAKRQHWWKAEDSAAFATAKMFAASRTGYPLALAALRAEAAAGDSIDRLFCSLGLQEDKV